MPTATPAPPRPPRAPRGWLRCPPPSFVPPPKRGDAEGPVVALPRPPSPPARPAPTVDRSHQRRGPPERHDLQPSDARYASGRRPPQSQDAGRPGRARPAGLRPGRRLRQGLSQPSAISGQPSAISYQPTDGGQTAPVFASGRGVSRISL